MTYLTIPTHSNWVQVLRSTGLCSTIWNQRKVVQQPSKVAMFDSDLVWLIQLKFDPKVESNKTLIELNLAFDLVRLTLISTNLTKPKLN